MEIENLRKKLLMRSEHRGIKEMDIILGRYARSHLSKFSESELLIFESFLENDDHLLFSIIRDPEGSLPEFDKFIQDIRNFTLNNA